MFMAELTVEKIKEEIRNKNAKWEVKEHNLAKRSMEEMQFSLGMTVDEDYIRGLRTKALPNIDAIISDFRSMTGNAAKSSSASASIDWRDHSGVTSIKNQAGCGSCVAFGTTATLESMVLIEQKLELDLSEAELFYCAGPAAGAGRCPQGGWWPARALPYLHEKGLSKEDCFPYQDNSPPCKTCPDRDKQAVHIKKDAEILDVDARKKYLTNIGPLIGGLDVYRDFMSYGKGVYSHVTGERLGGHCISVIGFDDKDGCWICKNSWGPTWGDNGFFKMAYGDEDSKMTERPMWGIYGTK